MISNRPLINTWSVRHFRGSQRGAAQLRPPFSPAEGLLKDLKQRQRKGKINKRIQERWRAPALSSLSRVAVPFVAVVTPYCNCQPVCYSHPPDGQLLIDGQYIVYATVDSKTCLVQELEVLGRCPHVFCLFVFNFGIMYDYCLAGERKERVACCCFKNV